MENLRGNSSKYSGVFRPTEGSEVAEPHQTPALGLGPLVFFGAFSVQGLGVKVGGLWGARVWGLGG